MKNTYKVNEEAVKKIAEKVYDNGTTVINRNNLEEMFPTFKESKEREDDRIRKELIDYFSSSHAAGTFRGIPWGRVVAWLEKQGNKDMGISEATKKKLEDNLNKALEKETPESCNEFLEKQGEQKLVEKVEPKFHEGEWITNGDYTWKIVEVKPLDYVLQSQDGNIVDDTISHVDEQFHSFTIEDTKDGDQCEQKPFGQRKECEDCQFNYAGECKGYCALKRNEQKPADKVEPRFKVGDWVVIDGEVLHVKEVTKDGYLTDEGGLIPFRNEKEAHIWTIQDAKDGGVLVYDNGCVEIILLFLKWMDEVGKGAYSYVHITSSGHHVHINDWSDCGLTAHPATKEQRELLFQKMKEAGYEWDADKKELKKIEFNPDDLIEKSYQQQADDLIDMVTEKPADKVEPKFKVGDWVVTSYGKVNQIVSVDKDDDDGYTLDDGTYFSGSWCDMFHLWTIKDAKAGDVLVSSSGKPFIFNGFFDNDPMAYGSLVADDSFWPASNSNWTTAYCKPATKEQRVLLFKKMHEAGYVWNAEKKELKKIKQESYPETLDKAIELYYYSYGNSKGGFDNLSLEKFKDIVNTFVNDYGIQNLAWSEEDDKQARQIERIAHNGGCTQKLQKQIADWFKSLKERVQSQPKQELSEEDNKMIIKICQNLYDYPRIKSPFDDESFNEAKKEVQFIKSLISQYNINE